MYGYPYYQNYNQNSFGSQPSYTQAQTPQDERIWVSSQQAGEAYLISPNGFARLWDSSQPRFYEKRADSTGRPLPMEIYEYKRISPQITTLTDDMNKLSTEDIDAKFEALSARIEALENAKKGAGKNAKQSITDDTSI